METVGGSKPENDFGHLLQTDFEAVESAWRCLSEVFAEHADVRLEVEINNLGGESTLTEYNKALTSLMLPRMADFSEASQKRLEAGHSLRILDSKSMSDQEIVNELALPHIDEFIDGDWRDTFSDLQDLLTMHGIPHRRNPNLVRGLDYYNGTCFEIKLETNVDGVLGQSQNTLLAGGRYDYLAAILSGDKKRARLPAVGWAAGVDRLCLILEDLEQASTQTRPRVPKTGLAILTIVNKQDSSEEARVVRKAAYLLRQYLQVDDV